MKTLPALKPKSSIKYGDIVQLGDHFLAYGDCRDVGLVGRLLKGQSVKLLLSDPPFGIACVESKKAFNGGTKHKAIANDQLQTNDQYRQFTKEYLDVIKPYLIPKNAAYLFNADRMLRPMLEGLEEADFHFAQLLIWVKSQPVINRMDFLVQHELVIYGWYGKHEFLKSKDKSVLFFPKPAKSPLHPTMKPISLLRSLILNSTRMNDVIFDGFLGSGSTLIAAEQTRRRCFGCEIDLQYCQIIIDRFEKLTGVKPKLIS